MATVEFAPALTRHVACRAGGAGATLGQALEAAFLAAPALRDYVLDEQARCAGTWPCPQREMLPRAAALARPLAPRDRVMVIQALTGG